MRKIGFKNFKRFDNLTPMDISPITMLVGANNSGKSSLIKGLLLANENIFNLEIPTGNIRPVFSFDLTKYDAGVTTFERCLNYNSSDKEIVFCGEYHFVNKSDNGTVFAFPNLNRFIISVAVGADDTKNNMKETSTYKAQVNKLCIEDRANLLRYRYDFDSKKMYLDVLATGTEEENALFEECHKLRQEIEGYKGKIVNVINKPHPRSELKKELEKLENKRRKSCCEVSKERVVLATVEMPLTDVVGVEMGTKSIFGLTIAAGSPICRYIDNIGIFIERNGESCKLINDSKLSNDVVNDIVTRRDVNVEAHNSADSADALVKNSANYIVYVHTHSVKAKTIFDASDKNDFLARTIHKFMGENSTEKRDKMHRFVQKWMTPEKFAIGNDFLIEEIDGAVGYYKFFVITESGKSIPLADLGTGSRQLMTLLLNLAIARFSTNDYNKPVVLIEEPEQNLHPNHQSKLIDLFNEIVNVEQEGHDCIKIIVETHSEYLIRKSQVLVAEKNYDSQEELEKKCPFKVYYFPKDGMPYDMEYQTNGKFNKPMDKGFLDVAAFLALDVLKAGKKK